MRAHGRYFLTCTQNQDRLIRTTRACQSQSIELLDMFLAAHWTLRAVLVSGSHSSFGEYSETLSLYTALREGHDSGYGSGF